MPVFLPCLRLPTGTVPLEILDLLVLLSDLINQLLRIELLAANFSGLGPCQISLFPQIQTVLAYPQLPGHLCLALATVDHHLHSPISEFLVVYSVYSFFLHAFSILL